jgi:hypothetical protein
MSVIREHLPIVIEQFSHILLWAPDFHEGDESLESEFDELMEHLQALVPAIIEVSGQQLMEAALTEVVASRRAFEDGDPKLGRHLIQLAEEHCRKALKADSTEQHRFVVDEDGSTKAE